MLTADQVNERMAEIGFGSNPIVTSSFLKDGIWFTAYWLKQEEDGKEFVVSCGGKTQDEALDRVYKKAERHINRVMAKMEGINPPLLMTVGDIRRCMTGRGNYVLHLGKKDGKHFAQWHLRFPDGEGISLPDISKIKFGLTPDEALDRAYEWAEWFIDGGDMRHIPGTAF